jgi:hypothetical protein
MERIPLLGCYGIHVSTRYEKKAYVGLGVVTLMDGTYVH